MWFAIFYLIVYDVILDEKLFYCCNLIEQIWVRTFVVDKKHFSVWSLMCATVGILNVTLQPLITITLTLTIKRVLNVDPETLILILNPQSIYKRWQIAALLLGLGFLD